MKRLRPTRDYVLCEKTEEPGKEENRVKLVNLTYMMRPGLFWAKVVAVGPNVMYARPGDVVLLPITMEPVRANHVLVPEREIVGIFDGE